MKKFLSILLAIALVAMMCVGFAACNEVEETVTAISFSPIAKENIKVGLICLHDENSTYDNNFIKALKETQTKLGLTDDQVKIVTGIDESDECYQKACELADDGCNIIIADSFGHESYMLKAAKKYPNVRFAHATGTTAHTELQGNFYNAFAAIYEGRFLAGIAAGMKLNEMIAAGQFTAAEAKMGYVGAFTYAEVMSGYTSFYLGAKSVCPTVTMEVTFTGSWYAETAEKNAANALIERGCKLISQHADSMGAPNACQEAGVPNVTYNVSTKDACGTTYLVASRINWAPYYEYLIECAMNGVTATAFDYVGTIATGSVEIMDLNTAVAAEGTADALLLAKMGLENGTIKVFDTAKDNYITVNGQKLNTFLADVDTDAAFTGDTQVISNGAFLESVYRSAPYFNVEIDGITLLDRNYGD